MAYRILHCLRAPVGGLFRHVRDLAEAQAARGLEIAVVCDSVANDRLTGARLRTLERHASLGLHLTAMSREIGLRDARAFAFTRDLASELRVDVIHGHGAKGGAYARLAAHALKSHRAAPAVLYTPHGGSLHYNPTSLKGRVYLGLERKLAPMTDGFIFESAYSARVFAEKVVSATGRERVVHNGLLPAEFSDHTPSKGAADFLYVGELRRLKGVDILLASLAEVRKSRPARLLVVGDGPDADEFKSLARQLGLAECVDFAGAMAPPPFNSAHCLVMPSRAESLPYVVLEAAAAGIPLIASDVGGIGEIVAGSDTRLVPPEDTTSLAAAMQDALANPDRARRRAVGLREAVKRRFHVDVMCDGVLAAYKAAISNRRAR